MALRAAWRAIVARATERALFVLFLRDDARHVQGVSRGVTDPGELNAEKERKHAQQQRQPCPQPAYAGEPGRAVAQHRRREYGAARSYAIPGETAVEARVAYAREPDSIPRCHASDGYTTHGSCRGAKIGTADPPGWRRAE